MNSNPEHPKREKMVGWYDPKVFLLTGFDSLISSIFGQRADYRQIEALAPPADESDQAYINGPDQPRTSTGQLYYDFRYHYKLKKGFEPDEGGDCNGYEHDAHGNYILDVSKPREELWLDYVADTGDGWDSTYAVAYYLTQPTLSVKELKKAKSKSNNENESGEVAETKRGEILVFGGDQVYPSANRQSYQSHLVAPYESALGETSQPQPFLFATPGNHDWYDSLVSFTRLFCSKDPFAGWLTRQSRSYFALRLPHNWWFIGIDVQLNADIDGAQIRFFKKVAKEMEEGDRIILGMPEPQWIHAKLYEEYGSKYNESSLRDLVEKVFSRRVKVYVFLAGDLHHYRRHEAADGTQKITAGGGGAFLHPTHPGRKGVKFDTIEEKSQKGSHQSIRTFTFKTAYPDEQTSKRLCWRNLYFPKTNWGFGLLTGLLYWLTSWVLVPIVLRNLNVEHFNFSVFFGDMFPNPAVAFWLALTFVAMVAFTDTHSLSYRLIAGGLHGVMNFLAAVVISFLACWLVVNAGHAIKPELKSAFYDTCHWPGCGGVGTMFKLLTKHTAIALIIFFGGFVAGPFLMGVYLLVSLNYFGRHYNEAFAALKIPDWKNFLRMNIDRTGRLFIYPIGIRKVPREWQPVTKHDKHPTAKFEPVGDSTPPHLIERPITLPR